MTHVEIPATQDAGRKFLQSPKPCDDVDPIARVWSTR
jgi:hypothetical protein